MPGAASMADEVVTDAVSTADEVEWLLVTRRVAPAVEGARRGHTPRRALAVDRTGGCEREATRTDGVGAEPFLLLSNAYGAIA